jgi:hypothetical protein
MPFSLSLNPFIGSFILLLGVNSYLGVFYVFSRRISLKHGIAFLHTIKKSNHRVGPGRLIWPLSVALREQFFNGTAVAGAGYWWIFTRHRCASREA